MVGCQPDEHGTANGCRVMARPGFPRPRAHRSSGPVAVVAKEVGAAPDDRGDSRRDLGGAHADIIVKGGRQVQYGRSRALGSTVV
jgi:hypothetical protein